jgi:hypothetical protein
MAHTVIVLESKQDAPLILLSCPATLVAVIDGDW